MSIELPIAKLVKKLSGIRWYVLIDRESNKIIDKSPNISEDKLDELIETSHISVELSEKMKKYSFLTSSKKSTINTVYVKLNGETIIVEKMGKNTLILNIDEKILGILSKIFTMIRGGESIKCKTCGHDLLHETIECPRCGRTIPFIAANCPFCNYSLDIKKCPGHGGFITSYGEPAKRDYAVIAITILIGVLIGGFTMFLSTYFPGYKWILYGLGGLISALIVLTGYLASAPR